MDNESYEVQLSELSKSIDESMRTGNYNEVIKLLKSFIAQLANCIFKLSSLILL